MQPRKLDVAFVSFGYGGNGGIKAQHPDVSRWLITTIQQAKADPRVGETYYWDAADTPITMCRNRAVCDARKVGADVLIMVDSDQSPDMYLGKDPYAEPFFQVAFDAIYDHYDRGPLVIGAPYVGPPHDEIVYVFHWTQLESDTPNDRMRIEAYSRDEALKMAGIQEAAALPTGLIMCDMRAFELTEPKDKDDKPWFYYEYTDKFEQQKASTEDVTATRDISIVGQVTLGYNPIRCAWSSWIGHWKPKCCGKPVQCTVETVGEKFRHAVLQDHRVDTSQREFVSPAFERLVGGSPVRREEDFDAQEKANGRPVSSRYSPF